MQIRTLAEAISHYGRDAYLLTVGQDGPHTSHVTIELRGGNIGCAVGDPAGGNMARAQRIVVLAAYRAQRICLDRQRLSRGRTPGDGDIDGEDHTHEVRAASPRPPARRQRRAVCERLPPPDAVTHR